MEIQIKLPPEEDKGHFKRVKRRLQIIKRMNNGEPDAVDDLVKFIIETMQVTAPPEADLNEFIMNLSQKEINAIFSPPDAVPPTSAV